MMATQEEAWHRRHAIQVAASLPDQPDDALIVLRLATRLVVDFLAEDEPGPIPGKVLAIVRDPA